MNKEEKINVDFKLEDIPMIIDTMEQLQQENKQLKEELQGFKELYLDKVLEFNKSEEKINKAIEYCECIYIPDSAVNIAFQKVVEILKGDSNEL